MKKHQSEHKFSAVISMMVTSVCVGVVYMWSAFKAASEEWFSWSASSANLVSSIMLFSFTVGCLIGGMLQDRVGPKKISAAGMILFGGGVIISSFLPKDAPIVCFYLTYSIIAGMGSGFVFNSTLSGIQKWFPDRLGLATGLGASAFAISTVVFSPVCSRMLEHMNIVMTLRIFGTAALAVGLTACMFIRIPHEDQSEQERHDGQQPDYLRKSLNLGQTVRTVRFWMFFMCLFFITGAWNMLTPLIKSLSVERGLAESTAVLCLSLTGVTNALGRITMSSLSDRIGRIKTAYLLCLIMGFASAALTVLTGSGFFIAVLAAAFAYGGPASVFPALCTDMFGPKYCGRNYGCIMLALGLSSITFNTLSGYLYERYNSYVPSFTMGACTAGAALVLVMMIKRFSSEKKTVYIQSSINNARAVSYKQ